MKLKESLHGRLGFRILEEKLARGWGGGGVGARFMIVFMNARHRFTLW